MSFDSFNPLTRHPFQTDDPSLLPIAAKVANAERLDFEDGVTLYRSGDILAVGWLANLVRERRIRSGCGRMQRCCTGMWRTMRTAWTTW